MLTHRILCEVGSKLLKRPESANGHGCHFTLIEPSCYGENPDVFGVRHGVSGYDVGTVLIEAKVSRSDFLSDKRKPHRMEPHKGMGKWRYYICPHGLIDPSELPDKWGLIYVSSGGGKCTFIKGAMSVPKNGLYGKTKFRLSSELKESFKNYTFPERNFQNEMNLMTLALARLTDAEKTLYLQRDLMNLQSKYANLQIEANRLKAFESNHDLKKKYGV